MNVKNRFSKQLKIDFNIKRYDTLLSIKVNIKSIEGMTPFVNQKYCKI